ncbi:MAG: histidine kinase, partial [Alistipes sp.]|nr:histidine kinase [Alistipes sp.]
AIASLILLFRISYTLIFNSEYDLQTGVYTEFQQLLGNKFALLVLLCGNVFFVSVRPRKTNHPEWRQLSTMLLIVLFSLVVSLLVYFDFPKGNSLSFALLPLLRLYAVILLSDIILFALCKLIAYLFISKAELRTERGKKHLAQFQYNKLKMQINPHFLFNSLNILDFLVQEQQTERASAFIRKLAECYRYMLKNEDEQLVTLSEEMEFAHKYTELLQERFTSGFSVHYDIPTEALNRHVIPCCLQLLIENATKHNVVSPERPLTVVIRVEGEQLLVSNNLQPRLSTHASTGMGLKNIRRQYEDLSERTIHIDQTETHYTVQLPLL